MNSQAAANLFLAEYSAILYVPSQYSPKYSQKRVFSTIPLISFEN